MPRAKIEMLMAEYPHQEWLAYLVGRISDKANIFVEDISIPPHKEAHGASAEAEPFHQPEHCVGIIHSHHSMGAFHSGTDQAYVDKTYPVSITVARNGSHELTYDAVSYTKTLCGKAITLKSTIKYVQPRPTFDKDGFLRDAKANIDKGKKVYMYEAQTRALSSPFVPIKYRLEGVVIDQHGRVLSKAELDDLRYNSMEGVW